MKYNIIGAGRLGKNIARSLSGSQMATLDSVCNTTLNNSINACQEIGFGEAVSSLEQLPKVDLTWITCSDDVIESIVYHLSQKSLIKPGSLVIHCSGALNSCVLAPLKKQGCSIASFHPLKAFRTGYLDSQAFNQIDCVMEGDPDACNWLKKTFEMLEARIITINPEAKVVYHAAATIASNYLVTLAFCSEELFLKTGMTQRQARAMLCNLMEGNIANLRQMEPIAKSLTGPLARGDISTLSYHLQAIDNPDIKELYKSAGLATLPMTQLTEKTADIIKTMLGS